MSNYVRPDGLTSPSPAPRLGAPGQVLDRAADHAGPAAILVAVAEGIGTLFGSVTLVPLFAQEDTL